MKPPSTQATAETVEEMKSLVQSGDIDLSEYKAAYSDKYGDEYDGSNDDICVCMAYFEHDYPDMDAVCEAMHAKFKTA